MADLRDALFKAGFRPTHHENERAKVPKKEKTKVQQNQEQRIFCEVCEKAAPDVEFYQHQKRSLRAQWLCAACADENCILDEFRMTQQSDHAKKGMFRRGYGHLKRF